MLVLFICAHCTYVIHVVPELGRLECGYGKRVQAVAISSNSAITHTHDGPEGIRAQAERQGWRFPTLCDASQAGTKGFWAAYIPDIVLFNIHTSSSTTAN